MVTSSLAHLIEMAAPEGDGEVCGTDRLFIFFGGVPLGVPSHRARSTSGRQAGPKASRAVRLGGQPRHRRMGSRDGLELDLERERGITILSKNTSVTYKGNQTFNTRVTPRATADTDRAGGAGQRRPRSDGAGAAGRGPAWPGMGTGGFLAGVLVGGAVGLAVGARCEPAPPLPPAPRHEPRPGGPTPAAATGSAAPTERRRDAGGTPEGRRRECRRNAEGNADGTLTTRNGAGS